jgi:hypothetical protein
VSGLQDKVLGYCSAAGEGTGHVHLLQNYLMARSVLREYYIETKGLIYTKVDAYSPSYCSIYHPFVPQQFPQTSPFKDINRYRLLREEIENYLNK